jgi:hypothetical protein
MLAFEAVGGMVIFVARLVDGSVPGETPHVVVGVALTLVYAVYQWRHWRRVTPIRKRLDYGIGLLAAGFMALTNVSGLLLAGGWAAARWGSAPGAAAVYPPALSAVHTIGSMLVLTFVGAHLGAVLLRDRPRRDVARL